MSEVIQNNKEREEKLKEIVQDLHEGSDIQGVRKKFADLIKNVSPEEIAAMEQALIAEGVPVEQIQKVCDVHVQVFEQELSRQKKTKTLPGHPVHTFREENKIVKQIVKKLSRLMRGVPKGKRVAEFDAELERLKELEIHYQRKENQLFPVLERVQFTGPSSVMWGKHDEIREMLKQFEQSYRDQEWKEFLSSGKLLMRAIQRMVFMEERILFPTSLRKLTDLHWAEIRNGEADIGYAWVKPGNLWDSSIAVARDTSEKLGQGQPLPQDGTASVSADTESSISLDVGSLTGEQINIMLKNIPLDITYVDENDKVLYYSQGRERLFPRSPAVIGRSVQNCHPPKSVHIVEKIVESFKKKEKTEAEFWLTMNDRFIHIRYFPLYDEDGVYKGVLEASQDVTDIRSLKGERRLLDW